MENIFKRYCKTLELKDDPKLIAEYRQMHAQGAVWQEITRGMKKVGIIDMELYLAGTRLFMVMDTEPDFDHDEAMARLAKLPRQSEWEALVSKFQKTLPGSSAKEKWKLIDRIFKMDQEDDATPEQGYPERVDSIMKRR